MFYTFSQELVNKCSCKRRKLSVHVVSKVTNPELPKEIEDTVSIFKNEKRNFLNCMFEIKSNFIEFLPQETRIEDVTVFKNSLGLCPLPKAYINITPVGTKSKL